MRLRAELTTEPFVGEAKRPSHVRSVAAALRGAGLSPLLGPLGSSVEGEAAVLLPALGQAIIQAFEASATRVTLQVGRRSADQPVANDGLAEALRPLLQRLQAELVPPDELRPGDVPLSWGGMVRWGVRLPAEARLPLVDGLPALLAEVAHDVGAPLRTLNRRDKQRAVRLLEERGAFSMRRAAEVIAEALGVSRFTVYNYLHRERQESESQALPPADYSTNC